MNKLFYLSFVLIMTFSCSENEEIDFGNGLTELENSLNLISPNGMRIASNVFELKDEIAGALKMTESDDFEIVRIDYFTWEKGYVADIHYIINGMNVGNIVKTKNLPVENSSGSGIAVVRPKTKTSSEGGDDTGLRFCERFGTTKICLECKIVIRRNDKGEPETVCDCETDCILRKY